MQKPLLRYKITDWSQIKECKSNNSRDLSIRYSEFVNSKRLKGKRIEVIDKQCGVLFACLLNAEGELLTDKQNELPEELSVMEILKQLERFGFLIEAGKETVISEEQLEYLKTVDGLGFDKIRLLGIRLADGNVETKAVVFKTSDCPEWLNNLYVSYEKEFILSLANGSAISISDIANNKNFRWDWLMNSVLNIKDIFENLNNEI